MADYEATTRSNYFHVKDEEKFHQIFEQIKKKNFGIELFTGSDHTYGFGCYSDVDMDDIFELQDIIPDDDCIIVMESGHENLRYVDGIGYVITKERIESLSIMSWVQQKAKELMQDPDYTTQIDY